MPIFPCHVCMYDALWDLRHRSKDRYVSRRGQHCSSISEVGEMRSAQPIERVEITRESNACEPSQERSSIEKRLVHPTEKLRNRNTLLEWVPVLNSITKTYVTKVNEYWYKNDVTASEFEHQFIGFAGSSSPFHEILKGSSFLARITLLFTGLLF